MDISPGRSRLADLVLHVSSSVIHPDWVTTRVHRRVGQGDWDADIRIIEGGHLVCFRRGNVRISEALTGANLHLPDQGLLTKTPVRQERAIYHCSGDLVEYQSCFEVELVDREVFQNLDQEMVLDGAQGDLFFRFPSTNRLSPIPACRIHVEPMPTGLAVQTFHSFPLENAFVRTQSLFERLPRKNL